MSDVFYRLSGAGNDFLALVEPERMPSADEVRAWCRRGVSLGADGVFVLSRSRETVDMVHINPDGSRAELCLNGSRCAVRLAQELGWDREGVVDLRTDSGVLASRVVGENLVEIELPAIVGELVRRVVTVGSRQIDGWFLCVGVPHFVLPWPDSLAGAPVAELGPPLRSHADLGSAGTNVDFVRFVSRDRFEIRTWERGVEAETLACGTGVVASVAVGLAEGWLKLPVTALTAGGFEIRVDGEAVDGKLRQLTFTGDARILVRGELDASASTLPSAAEWS